MKIPVYASAGIMLILIAACSSAQSQTPQITILANSIDLPLSQGYIVTLNALGYGTQTITAADLPSHQGDPFIIILGGQHSPEGIGRIVDGLLTQKEKDAVLASSSSKTAVIIPSLWTGRQKIMIFAGYGKEQTRKVFGEAQGDIIKSLRFNDSAYLDNFSAGPVNVPPLDDTQPFTELDAYQANTLINTTAALHIIDVRGVPFYQAGHIPGAVNIPAREMDKNLARLDKSATYLLYCGGNSESITAANFLAASGYKNIYRLVDGYMAWRMAGFPRQK
jgi:rhodanese-related sulfurtransferase